MKTSNIIRFIITLLLSPTCLADNPDQLDSKIIKAIQNEYCKDKCELPFKTCYNHYSFQETNKLRECLRMKEVCQYRCDNE